MNGKQLSRREWSRSTSALGLAAARSIGNPRNVPADTKNGNDATDIGARRELFGDTILIDRLAGKAVQRLHHPEPRETATYSLMM